MKYEKNHFRVSACCLEAIIRQDHIREFLNRRLANSNPVQQRNAIQEIRLQNTKTLEVNKIFIQHQSSARAPACAVYAPWLVHSACYVSIQA